jgi:acyl carrier protein
MEENDALTRLQKIFVACFGTTPGEKFDASEYKRGWLPTWDSVAHMMMVAELEDTFDVTLDVDDVIDMESYAQVVRILKRLNVDVEE